MKQSLDSSVFLKLASVIILQNCLLAHQRMITEYGILPKDMKMSQREIKGVLFGGKSWNIISETIFLLSTAFSDCTVNMNQGKQLDGVA